MQSQVSVVAVTESRWLVRLSPVRAGVSLLRDQRAGQAHGPSVGNCGVRNKTFILAWVCFKATVWGCKCLSPDLTAGFGAGAVGFFGLEKPALGAALAGDTAQRDAPSRVAFVLERRRLREVEKRTTCSHPDALIRARSGRGLSESCVTF